MCDSHKHITVHAKGQYDPTHTTALRNLMVGEGNRRFVLISRLIKRAIVDEDVFGLNLAVMQSTPGKQAFKFLSDSGKIDAFLDWLQDLIDNDILEIEGLPMGIASRNWLEKYLQEAYKRGVARAREELRRKGYEVPTIAATGGIGASMQAPLHLDTVALLYMRTFNELKGVTDSMRQIIARILSEGIMSGANPRRLARELVAAINGTGAGDLGLFDRLGRFIPAKRRAEIIARTEIIRAHHYANINEYMTWGAYGVSVQAEWHTAGDNRVCPQCSSMEGNIYTLEQVLPMIPVHPQCRCIAIPIVKTVKP